MKSGIFILGMLLIPSFAMANVVINEIMYDLEGSDSVGSKGREWVEIFNDSSQEINLSGWKFNDGDGATNHGLNEPPAQGLMSISAGGFAILAVDASIFLSDHPNYSGTVIDILGVTSLNNTGATLKLINANGNEIHSVVYEKTMGANGDGNSLQLISGNWSAAIPTPGAINAGSDSQSQEQQSQSQSSGAGSGGSSYIPPENLPQIKAYAGEDKTVIAGAAAEFRGQAFGLDGKPMANARYLWNFGDGSSREGQNIAYFYRYPGEYVVVLNISSGEYSASDYMLVKAVPNQVFISEIKPGADSFIELENKSKEGIDISGCRIQYNNQNFIFPPSTRIRAGAYVAIPSFVSGMIFYPGKGVVEFFYPGGFKADSFNYDGFPSAGETFNRGNDKIFIAAETPGAKNTKIKQTEQGPALLSTSSDSKVAPQVKDAPENLADEQTESDNQAANIITVGQPDAAKNKAKIYLLAVLGLIILAAAAAIFFIRRHSSNYTR
jgi:hypothetical protein